MLEINSPVISNVGIVGKIISNSINYSVILPLNHSAFKVGVMCKRSHLQGIMESDAFGNSYMNLIKLGSDIVVGDTIVTSNISTIFPKGYPVGTITRLREAPNQVYMYANLQTFAKDQLQGLRFPDLYGLCHAGGGKAEGNYGLSASLR